MTPIQLYNALSTAYPQHIVESVCCTETNCKKRGYCLDKQSYPVLDFDEIKKEYYHGQPVSMPASVDAVCVGSKQKHVCFVELKGWENYISHISQQRDSIEETAGGYNLDGKLLDSQELCKKITSDPDLFLNIPTIFLLVTDIDVKTHGIESFADNMLALASTGTDIYSQCATAAKRTLDSEIHIDHYFIYCKDFDEFVANL